MFSLHKNISLHLYTFTWKNRRKFTAVWDLILLRDQHETHNRSETHGGMKNTFYVNDIFSPLQTDMRFHATMKSITAAFTNSHFTSYENAPKNLRHFSQVRVTLKANFNSRESNNSFHLFNFFSFDDSTCICRRKGWIEPINANGI